VNGIGKKLLSTGDGGGGKSKNRTEKGGGGVGERERKKERKREREEWPESRSTAATLCGHLAGDGDLILSHIALLIYCSWRCSTGLLLCCAVLCCAVLCYLGLRQTGIRAIDSYCPVLDWTV
jgi:hypothetical protein